MNATSKPDKKTLLQLAIDALQLDVSVTEAGGKTLSELEIDSLQIIQLSMELEDNFSLQINMENLRAEMTLSDILDSVITSTY